MKIAVPKRIKELAELTGVPFYVVGGYPRNALLFGRNLSDYDICGPLTVSELTEKVQPYAKVIPVNPRIGTVLICYKGENYEYTTFRRDSYPIGGVHTPTEVEFVRSVEEDSLRRDFRVNSLYIDVLSEEVIDPLGGLADIEKRVLVTSNGRKTFDEDGLRLLRLVRFACELGFKVEEQTLEYAKELAHLIKDISAERIIVELKKILLSDSKNGVKNAPIEGIKLLLEIGLDKYISRELSLTLRSLSEEKLSRIIKLDGVDRAAFVCYYAYKLIGENCIPLFFGQGGLKCSNVFVKDMQALVEFAYFEGTEEEKRIFIQSRFTYAERADMLCLALGKNGDFYKTYCDMQNKGVTFNPKSFHYCGLILKKMKIKPENRHKVLNRMLEESARKNRSLSEEEEKEILMLYL